MERAWLGGADLEGANLTGAHLARANLSGADLERANLRNADLERTYLRGAYLEDIIGLEHARREGAIGLGEPAVAFVGGMVQEGPWPVRKPRR